MEKTILVTGGAGYIGSITVRRLLEEGYNVIVLDNLSRGHIESVPAGVEFIEGDIADEEKVESLLKKYSISSVIHFAAYAYVGESVENPSLYFENNIKKGLIFLEILKRNNIKKIIFSSSCATYGIPESIPITEKEKQKPINPYGLTKLLFEKALQSYDESFGLKYVIVRYFNAAGAAYGIGEDHQPETHLIPLVFQVALGKAEYMQINGVDYPTEDGTCVRDYIHVLDLAEAHLLALEYLENGGVSEEFNLGLGKGYSVRQIIDLCQEITSHPIPIKISKRRTGDPAYLVASAEKIKKELGWQAKYAMKDMIQSAWDWHRGDVLLEMKSVEKGKK
ncbi:UDP-glucose 4-epimerase GalE [Candidatus Woesearchaeota archaeon]|nr:UDP-glucose 4-epimerase GalE [Candidatus Woesearchaeota archaeon]